MKKEILENLESVLIIASIIIGALTTVVLYICKKLKGISDNQEGISDIKKTMENDKKETESYRRDADDWRRRSDTKIELHDNAINNFTSMEERIIAAIDKSEERTSVQIKDLSRRIENKADKK